MSKGNQYRLFAEKTRPLQPIHIKMLLFEFQKQENECFKRSLPRQYRILNLFSSTESLILNLFSY